MDGTRLGVWETTIEPRCSAVLDGRDLFPDSLREAGIGVIKLVVDAHELGSLRPYFHLMTPTSISTTHEKTGPHNLDRGVSPRRYNFLFPIARADREEEVYLFATNTEVETMEGQELVWRSQEGDEERVPVPRLELDQSACVERSGVGGSRPAAWCGRAPPRSSRSPATTAPRPAQATPCRTTGRPSSAATGATRSSATAVR